MKISVILAMLICMVPTSVQAQQWWVSTHEDVWVQQERGDSLGLLRYGDQVTVLRCVPNCVDRTSWMYLAPYGRIRRLWMDSGPRDQEAVFLGGSPHNFRYAKVLRNISGTNIDRNDEIIIRSSRYFDEQGLAQLPDESTVPLSSLRILSPSDFHGWVLPPQHFVFVRENTIVTASDGSWESVNRYDRFSISLDTRHGVTTPRGVIPRNKVRVGYARTRPSQIPESAQWIHVSLDEQVLTAYEGDRMIFATLVSTGRKRGSTHTGVFQVRRKILYTHMRGGGRRPYSVQGVPFVMYYDGAIAIHGSYWADTFGTVRSHGCVNLSITDAEFLYNWTLPEVPAGWRAVHPTTIGTNIWVIVE